MTRSSTNKLFTPYKEPEREFRSSRRHFKTLSLDELRSPDFNLLSDQEYLEEEVAETMAKTMEQYMSKTRADYGSGVARPKIEDKDNFKLKGQFLKELRTNTFSGSDHEDANEHVEKVLEIVGLFHIPNITIDQVILREFPMSLTGAAIRWLRNEPTDLVMLDSEDSTITYMAVFSPFEGLLDIGSPRVDGLPMMLEDPYVEATLQASPSPDYVPGSEYPPLPEFVPKPVYPEFMPSEDEVFPAEEQPLPAAVSPTTDLPRYIADSNLEEDEKDPKEDPTDYPADGGDDDDDDDEDDDEDDDDDVEEDEDEEEEEHPARPTLSYHLYTVLLAIPTPPPSPLSPLSSPLPPILSPLPQILSPPLLVSSPPLPASPTYPLRYRAAMIWLRAKTPSTSYPLPSSTPPSGTPPLLPIPLPTPSPPLLLPSTVCRAGISEVTLPPQKRMCIALGLRYEVGESSFTPTARPTGGFRADYGFIGTLDDEC
ncbi:hypothetical protein Tco_1082959 [Tanacetum coccineum]|uniref:Uncharacterized protein n=1 Tax=Tanacetum coccineum TaxID=301880 RepID=A0ABQ5I2S3_9ASTR